MSAETFKIKGNEAFQAKDYQAALKYFTEAIEIDPKHYILYGNRSGAYAALENFEKALQDAEKCIELNPSWPKGYSRKGYAEFKLKKYIEAAKTYKEGLKYDPNNKSLLDGLQQLQYAITSSSDFLSQIETSVDAMMILHPFKKYSQEDPTFCDRLKKIVHEIVKDPRQLQIIMAVNQDPKITEALKYLYRLDDTSVKDTTKETHKKSDVPSKPSEKSEAEIWKEKGNQLYQSRKFDEALKAYDEALKISPDNFIYQLNKAAVYLEMKDYDACLAECQNILDRRYELKIDYDKVAKIYNRMAVCYRRMQDYDKAIAMYEKCLTEDNQRQYRAALSETKTLKEKKDKEDYINPQLAEQHRLTGNDYFKKNLFPEAKKEYDEAIRRDPSDARLYANRAATLIKLMEFGMALADAEKSLELNPNVSKVWARKGNIHMMLKQYNKALSAFQEGLKVDKDSKECQYGLEEVTYKIQESLTSDKVDEEQIKHSMADPEIQALLTDPQFGLILKGISENPANLQAALRDPHVASGIQKLMAAGILRVSN